MNRIANFGFAALASVLCAQAEAQAMYKCKDAAGRITYAGKECNLLGLLPAGEVTGRASVQPALKLPPAAPVALPSPPPEVTVPPAAEQAGRGEGAEAAAGQDGRRCFKTAKGTRCNDDKAD
jgi:hypothetical protein